MSLPTTAARAATASRSRPGAVRPRPTCSSTACSPSLRCRSPLGRCATGARRSQRALRLGRNGQRRRLPCVGCLERRLGASCAWLTSRSAESQEHAAPQGAQAGQIVLHLRQLARHSTRPGQHLRGLRHTVPSPRLVAAPLPSLLPRAEGARRGRGAPRRLRRGLGRRLRRGLGHRLSQRSPVGPE
jgi:hypothetical protein